MADVIKSYLVSLGFEVDQPTFRKFADILARAGNLAESTTAGVAKEVFKWQTAITGAFAAIAAGILGTVDEVAQADQGYRLFGLRMMVTTDNARKLKLALDAIGQPLDVIALDPELHARFMEIYGPGGVFDKLGANILGANFESNMLKARQLGREVQNVGFALKFMVMEFANEAFKDLFGDGKAAGLIHELFDFLDRKGKTIADTFAMTLSPAIRQSGEMLGEIAVAYTNFIAFLNGDKSLSGTAFSWEKLATAIERTVRAIMDMLTILNTPFRLLVTLVGQLLSLLNGTGFDAGAFGKIFREYTVAFQGLVGAGYGKDTAIGTGGAGWSRRGATAPGGGDVARQAAVLAQQVGQRTGVDPRLIFEQWAFETGGFTSRVGRELNNLAGIRIPGTTLYEKFGSLDQFAQRYGQVIQGGRYRGLSGAHSESEFAGILKQGGYYEAPQGAYQHGMESFRGMAGSIDASTTISQLNVTVGGTNASAQEIGTAIGRELDRRNQLTLAQLAPGGY